jgi:hypothetical protein
MKSIEAAKHGTLGDLTAVIPLIGLHLVYGKNTVASKPLTYIAVMSGCQTQLRIV